MNNITIGKQYTRYSISDFMACTSVQRFTIRGYDAATQRFIIQPQGKRKQYYLNNPQGREARSIALFEGWEQPFKADSETSSFSGNALINIVGDAAIVRAWFETKNLYDDFDKSLVVVVDQSKPYAQRETAVFPELQQPGAHAVLDRIIAKQATQ
jgi:hypothetical protein